jgi:hypothetical protein
MRDNVVILGLAPRMKEPVSNIGLPPPNPVQKHFIRQE